MPEKVLNRILVKERVGRIEQGTGYLVEEDKTAKLKLVKLVNIPNALILIANDRFDTQTFFKKEEEKKSGSNKRCDYLLVTRDGLYFIELKSHEKYDRKTDEHKKVTNDVTECINKFKAVGCIAEYIDNIIKTFYGTEKLFEGKQKRYIVFYYAPSINKTTTSRKPLEKEINNSPETYRSIPVANECEFDFELLN